MEKRLKQFIIGAMIVTLAHLAGYIISPIEVRYINSLTDNTVLIGLTYGIGALLFGLFSVWLGRISDRIGRNKLILSGCLLGIAYPLLYASTFNVFQYMGIKFAWALSSVACIPIVMAYLQDALKGLKKKGQYLGVMYSVQSIVGAGGSFLGGWLSDNYSLVTPYFAMSIVFVLATVIALWQMKYKTVAKKIKDKRDPFFGIKYFFKKPALRFYLVLNTAFGMNWGIKVMLWPLIIYGMTAKDTMTGSVFATAGVVAFILLPYAGKIVDKKGVYSSAFASMAFLAVSGVVLVLAKNIYLFWVFAAIYAIGEALNGPMQGVLLTEEVESKYRGEVLGIDALFDQVAGFTSPFVAGLLLMVWPAQNVLAVYIALFWIAIPTCAVLYKNLR